MTTGMPQSAAANIANLTAMAGRRRFARWALIYGLLIVYASVIVGPLGFQFKPMSLGEAWSSFLTTGYRVHGSDQRADWVANLLMLIPFGFLMTGAFWPKHGGKEQQWVSAGIAYGLCIVFVLVVKFGQLWFPPRTVSLNYIISQSIGSFAGVVLFRASRGRLETTVQRFFEDGARVLTVILAAYSAALLLYALVPFDFAVSGEDFGARMSALPGILFSLPGQGRAFPIRVVLIVAATLSAVPLGMLLKAQRPTWSVRRVAIAGFFILFSVFFLGLFILSANPQIFSLIYRTGGIVLGAHFMRQLAGRDMVGWQWRLSRLVPGAALVYLLALLFVSDVLNFRVVPYERAVEAFDSRGLVPFWHYYIVSKARGAEAFVVQMVMYAPVGVMIWLRRGERAGGPLTAGMLALTLSLIVELARWLKQGYQPDFTDPLIAALAAALAVRAMPHLWRMLDTEAHVMAGLSARSTPTRSFGKQQPPYLKARNR